MGIRQIVQNILDATLIDRGILSNHIRRVEAATAKNSKGKPVKINPDMYIVFRILTSRNGHGDGKPVTQKPFVDINIYYTYDRTDSRFEVVEKVIADVKHAFIKHGQFVLANDESDIYDLDNHYRGVNLEFRFIGLFAEATAEVENAP